MSTNNYTYTNVCIVVHDDLPDDYDLIIDEDIADWKVTLGEKIKGFEPFLNKDIYQDDALILGEVVIYRKNGDVYATIQVTYQSGYYVGACLDWKVVYNEDYYYNIKPYNLKPKTLEKRLHGITNRITKQLKRFGTQVVKVAQLSNGESFYKAIK
jgi:hypothetical protein